MKTFSIKELENLCDIKAHTIRVWEKRYAVFEPQRTASNARRYTLDDLEKLLSFALLTKNCHKISALAKMPFADVQQSLSSLVHNAARIERAVQELVLCMYRLNVSDFESILDTSFLSWPAGVVVKEIIHPFLDKVGLLCQGNRLNEEHFVVTAIRKKLYWSIQRSVAGNRKEKTVLLFLGGEKQLDLLLLYHYFLLETEGYRVIHLGVDVSVKNLEDFLRVQKVDYLLTYFNKKPAFSVTELSQKMNVFAPHAKLVVLKHPRCFSPEAEDNVFAIDSHEVLPFIAAEETTRVASKEALELTSAY